MTILEILDIANAAYPDEFLGNYYNLETGEFDGNGSGDTLAEFIVRELIETYVESDTDSEQLAEAIRVIKRGMENLLKISWALVEKRDEVEDLEVQSAMKARGEK